MKRIIALSCLLICIIVVLTACGDSDSKDEPKRRVEKVTAEPTSEPTTTPTPTLTPTPTPTPSLSRDIENEELTLTINGKECKGAFTGHLNDDGLLDGYSAWCSVMEPDEWTYQGNFKNGYFHGRGILNLTSDGRVYVMDGSFTYGDFTPSFAERYKSMGLSGMTYFGEYSVSFEQIIFIDEDLFVNASEERIKQMPLQEFSAKGFKKSRAQDTVGLIKLNLTASQAFEDRVSDFWGYSGYITEVLAYDKGMENYYTIMLFGRTDVCEGDNFEVYALPISTSAFDNVGGGKTNVIVLLACSMK